MLIGVGFKAGLCPYVNLNNKKSITKSVFIFYSYRQISAPAKAASGKEEYCC
ncbi:MAG: hypothetical protein IPP46_14185 [Bacteroidetes bacterium]|nr:hypothetical protein [Bacteroidota bacterium]